MLYICTAFWAQILLRMVQVGDMAAGVSDEVADLFTPPSVLASLSITNEAQKFCRQS